MHEYYSWLVKLECCSTLSLHPFLFLGKVFAQKISLLISNISVHNLDQLLFYSTGYLMTYCCPFFSFFPQTPLLHQFPLPPLSSSDSCHIFTVYSSCCKWSGDIMEQFQLLPACQLPSIFSFSLSISVWNYIHVYYVFHVSTSTYHANILSLLNLEASVTPAHYSCCVSWVKV